MLGTIQGRGTKVFRKVEVIERKNMLSRDKPRQTLGKERKEDRDTHTHAQRMSSTSQQMREGENKTHTQNHKKYPQTRVRPSIYTI